MEMMVIPHGLIAPVFTPTNEDMTVNYSVIPTYAEYLKKNNIRSILVGGTTGEHMCLGVSDRISLIEEWIKTAKKNDMDVMVQVGGAPFCDVIQLAKLSSKLGADSLLTLPELYFKPQSVDELVSYVKLVARAAPDLPVFYYHIPSLTNVNISMPEFVAAATRDIANFKGIKFTSNDLSECRRVKDQLNDEQEVFLGSDTLLAPAGILGISSAIGTTFNVFPRLARALSDSVNSFDYKTSRRLQSRLSAAVEAIVAEGPWVPSMKAAMELMSGIKMGPPLLPQKPIFEAGKQRMLEKLRNMDVANY